MKSRRRLLTTVWIFGLLIAVWAFAAGYLWDHGLTAQGITTEAVVKRSIEVLVSAFLIIFPMWLVLAKFRQPKKGSPSKTASASKSE